MNIIEKIKSLPTGRRLWTDADDSMMRVDDTRITTTDLINLTTALQTAVEALEKFAENSNWYWSEHEQKDCFDIVPAPQNAHDIADEALANIHALIGETKGGEYK